jgi:hypothetical protein
VVTTKIGSGLVVFWSLAEFTDRTALKAAWDASGFDDYVPEPRANVSILKEALVEVFGGSRALVRPLATRNGFAVVREERGADENRYEPVLTAKVHDSGPPVYSGDSSRAGEVTAAYHRHAGRVVTHQMASALVRILMGLGGTRLRPSGSVYWLPGDREVWWEKVVAGFEKSADSGKSVGYAIRHDLDADAIVAVRDAIVHEVNTEAARLKQEILAGDLGERAVQTRKREAQDLKRKVSEYEHILGVGLTHLKNTLDTVDQADATAALLLAAVDPFADSAQQEVCHAA